MSGQHWLPRAREMRAAGHTLAAIGEAVGRCEATVCQALKGRVRVRREGAPQQQSRVKESRYVRKVRAYCRTTARETGRPVAELYAECGVAYVDRSRAWDERRAQSLPRESLPRHQTKAAVDHSSAQQVATAQSV